MNPAAVHTRIEPSTGWKLPDLREALHFRDLFLILIGRDLKVRYKQTALGVGWVVLQPLLAAGLFSVIFGALAGFDDPDAPPYFLITFVGMTLWTLFAQALTKSTDTLVANAHLVSKIYFPRILMPASVCLGSVIDFLVVFTLVLIATAIFWHLTPIGALLIPLAVLLTLLIAFGFGLMLGSLATLYRDVKYATPLIVQLGLFATPVVYPVAQVAGALAERDLSHLLWLYYANPMAGAVQCFRFGVLGSEPPPVGAVLYSAGFAAVVVLLGMLVFRRVERSFADVI